MDRLTYILTKIEEGYAAGKSGLDDGMVDRLIELSNMTAEIKAEHEILQAIRARINGVWDDPALLKHGGMLLPDVGRDIQRMLEEQQRRG
jgi:hypothetical protein